MTYHPLTNDTAQTPERRREEAEDRIKMIDESYYEQLTEKEKVFVEDQRFAEETSPKQVLWLRDICDRYQ
jgi:hypothetical protein